MRFKRQNYVIFSRFSAIPRENSTPSTTSLPIAARTVPFDQSLFWPTVKEKNARKRLTMMRHRHSASDCCLVFCSTVESCQNIGTAAGVKNGAPSAGGCIPTICQQPGFRACSLLRSRSRGENRPGGWARRRKFRPKVAGERENKSDGSHLSRVVWASRAATRSHCQADHDAACHDLCASWSSVP